MEVIVSTMDKENPKDLYKEMNLNTDAIIINQSDKFLYEKFKINENKIQTISFNEKGVGLSRNSGMMRSKSSICIMADDDMRYVDGYEKIIKNAYEKYDNADMIVFNVIVHKDNKEKNTVKKNGRVRLSNSLSYGTVMFTFKKESINKKNISFSLLFGGGTRYGSGEDSLFIWSVIKSGLKVMSCTETIADVYNDESSWFKGYNEKYFYDKGALFKALSPKLYFLLISQFIIRHNDLIEENLSVREAFKYMMKGAKNY